MRLFREDFRLEFLRRPKKDQSKGKYEIIITRTYNSSYRYKIDVLLNGKSIIDKNTHWGGDYKASNKWDCRAKARKLIKEYEKEQKEDKVIHRLYM
jgi:hypothetical protein